MQLTAKQTIPLIRLDTMRVLLKQATIQGLDIADILAESGCPDILTKSNPATYMPEVCLLNFMDKLVNKLSKQQLATFLSGSAALICQPLLDKRYLDCLNMKQAILLFTQQIKSYSNFPGFDLINTPDGDYLVVNQTTKKQALNHWSETFTLLLAIQFIRQLTATEWLPSRVKLMNDDIHQLETYIHLSQIQVYFSQDQLAIGLDDTIILSPVANVNIKETQFTDKQLPPLSFTKNVEYALSAYIGCNNCSIDEFCDIVGLHKRLLQRALKTESSSYKQIKEKLTIDFAIKLIQLKRFSMADIAEHLGYHSTSQFARAVKRVTGQTPLQHR